ncbi:MAG: hypothetical protein IKO59_02850, partial [Bacteroidales bacterium]|nr:hypothetical protein [Bacteroidales bacterium]
MNILDIFRKAVLPMMLATAIMAAQAQGTYVCNETFGKNTPQGWSVQPAYSAQAPTWRTEKGLVVSASYAAHGYVPYASGDTAELITPYFDCQQYEYVILKFSHICKVLPSDICQIMYQEKGLGVNYKWRPIPNDAYKGKFTGYKANLAFDHGSYSEWKANDTFAQPASGWWKEEIFDLSNYAGYSEVRFKFVIRKGSYPGSFIAAGWYVDDVQLLCAAHAIQPPVVAFTSNIADTVFTTGPFVVNAKVATRTNGHILTPYLHTVTLYSGKSKHDSIKMKATTGDSMWTATIPQQYFGTSVQYYIIGRDTFGNNAKANAGFYVKYPGGFDSNSVAMYSIDKPGRVSITNPQSVQVSFKNKGLNNLKSTELHWSLNGVYQGSKKYTGNLPCDFIDTITLGSYIHRVNDYDTVTVWIKMPNNVVDKAVNDDTLQRISLGCAKASSGTFAVGPNSQYKTLKEAMDGIYACGAGGDITIEFENGTYIIDSVLRLNTAFMNGHHLTFTSKSKNRDSVTISYKASITAPGMITLNNTENVTFSYLTIHNSSTSNSNTVCLNGPIDNVTFYHCVLRRTNGTGFATSGYQMTIGSTALNATTAQANDNGNNGLNAFVRDLRFIGNHIDNGCRNVITMATTHRLHRLVFNDNTITDNTAAGIMVYRADSVTCNRNRVWVKDKTSSYWSPGIQLSVITGDSVCGNFISFLNQGTTYGGPGISVSGTSGKPTGSGKSGRILIANNVILGYSNSSYVRNNAGSSNLLTVSKAQADVFFNSVYNGRTSAAPTSGNNNKTVYVMGINDTSDIHMVGNQLIAFDDKNQHTLNVAAATAAAGKVVSEHNNFYFANSGKTIAYYNGNAVTSLAALQPLINDKGSISADPGFSDPTKGLQLKDYTLFMVPNPGIPNDFEDSARKKITAIGAYAGKLAKLDASLGEFAGTQLVGGQSSPVKVTLTNLGDDDLKSAVIGWSVNGTAQTPKSWSGLLTSGSSDTVTLGSVNAPGGKQINIVAWVYQPNQDKDPNPNNDTIRMQEFICGSPMKGSYTVGGTSPDFASFDDAYTIMTHCGIGGAVTLVFRAGQYSALSIADSVPGSSATSTIRITADKGATVRFDNGTNGATLKNAMHWIFDGVAFGNTSKADCGVAFEGMIRNILIRNCDIQASNTAVKTEAAVRYNNPTGSTVFMQEVRLIGNRIEGGAYNIHMACMAGSTTNMPSASLTIDSNIMKEAAAYGLYSESYAHYKSVRANDVTGRKGADEYCGLWFHSYNDIDALDANRVRAEATGVYGIVLSTYINTSAKGLLSNSEITLTGTKFAYGITLTDPYQEWDVAHNSVLVKCDKGNAYAVRLYNNSGKQPFNLLNNLLVAEGATAYPVYVEKVPMSISSYYVLDYNNYYAQNMVGYFGKAIATLADWRSNTGQDAHSVAVQPQFAQQATSLELKDYSAFACNRLNNVPRDILGKARNTVTTMGCYSGNLKLEADLAAVAFVNPDPTSAVACHGDFTDIEVTISNIGNIAADFAKSPLKVRIEVTGIPLNSILKDTIIRQGKLDPAQSGRFRLLRISTISAIQHIRVTLSDTADHNPANDTISMDYNTYRVYLPFDANFSAMPQELLQECRKGGSLWKVASSGSLQPAFGTKCLLFDGREHTGDRTNIILNSINIQNTTDPKLSLWYAHHNGNDQGDSLIIKATTDGGATYTVLGRLCAAAATAEWKLYEYPLDKFSSAQCLCIVMETVAGAAEQQIDRILISGRNDISIQLLLPDLDKLSACSLQNLPVRVVVKNLIPSEAAVSCYLSVAVSGASNQMFRRLCQGIMPGNASDTLLVTDSLDLSAEGIHKFEAILHNVDDDPTNDTARGAISISQDIALAAVSGIDSSTLYSGDDQLQIKATVTNKGTVPVDRVVLRMYANGQALLADTLRTHIKAGDSVTQQLSQPFVVPFATKENPTFSFRLEALLPCDAATGDNSISITGKV